MGQSFADTRGGSNILRFNPFYSDREYRRYFDLISSIVQGHAEVLISSAPSLILPNLMKLIYPVFGQVADESKRAALIQSTKDLICAYLPDEASVTELDELFSGIQSRVRGDISQLLIDHPEFQEAPSKELPEIPHFSDAKELVRHEMPLLQSLYQKRSVLFRERALAVLFRAMSIFLIADDTAFEYVSRSFNHNNVALSELIDVLHRIMIGTIRTMDAAARFCEPDSYGNTNFRRSFFEGQEQQNQFELLQSYLRKNGVNFNQHAFARLSPTQIETLLEFCSFPILISGTGRLHSQISRLSILIGKMKEFNIVASITQESKKRFDILQGSATEWCNKRNGSDNTYFGLGQTDFCRIDYAVEGGYVDLSIGGLETPKLHLESDIYEMRATKVADWYDHLDNQEKLLKDLGERVRNYGNAMREFIPAEPIETRFFNSGIDDWYDMLCYNGDVFPRQINEKWRKLQAVNRREFGPKGGSADRILFDLVLCPWLKKQLNPQENH